VFVNNRDESGIAMITAVLISSIVLALGLVSVQLSFHNLDQSALDRKRVVSVDAAEAGLDDTIRQIQSSAVAALLCRVSGTLNGSSYQVTIDYYRNYPPTRLDIDSPLRCLPLSVDPAGARITATGDTPSRQFGRRKLQSQVRLTPILGGANQAIFSQGSINLRNNLTLTGQNGNDADVYTNGDFYCDNSPTVSGSVLAPRGHIVINGSCQVKNNAWAGGDPGLARVCPGSANSPLDVQASGGEVCDYSNSAVGHDVISSKSYVLLIKAGSDVNNNATAGTRVCQNTSLCRGRVARTVTQGLIQNPPAGLPLLPPFIYDASLWTGQTPPYVITELACNRAAAAIASLAPRISRPTVFHVTGCTQTSAATAGIAFTNNVSFNQDAAIVVDGSISFLNHVDLSATSGTHSLRIIVPSLDRTHCTDTYPPNITARNLVAFDNLPVFVYSPCTVTWENHGANAAGQVFGGTVNISNNFSMQYMPIFVPGFGQITGHKVDIAYKREIA
jgi:hypothetical protein